MASDVASSTRLTLSHILNPPSWDFPEWNGPPSDDPNRTADKLGDLDKSLALLQRYRNTLRPVHRLAPDILLLIFEDVVDEDEGPLHPRYGSNAWIYLAHVCHRWRTIVSAYPLMWTRISTQYPEAALACLSRSMDAPLSLMVSGSAVPESASQVLNAALPHVGRIRHIYLPSVFREADLYEMLTPILEAWAPVLQTLYVYKVEMDGGCFALPTMFDQHTPRLTTLKLCYAFPELSSVSYTSLKQLLIKGKKGKPIAMELSRLLEILEACPHLEVLQFIKATIVSSSTVDSSRLLQLDKLRYLDIDRSSGNAVADLFSRLILPDCATHVQVWLERAADFTFCFGVPDNLHDTHHLQDIRQLYVEYTSASDRVVIQGSTRRSPFRIVANIPQNSDIGEMSTVAGQLLLAIVKTLDLASLEEFTISEICHHQTHLGFTRKGWIEVFQRMPLLKALHVRIDTINDAGFSRGILSALATPGEMTGRLLCPHLETLTVAHDKMWSSLHCYLLAQERAKHGHPLRRLSMRLPYYENIEDIDDTDLPALRRVVDVVDLDPPMIEKPRFPDYSW